MTTTDPDPRLATDLADLAEEVAVAAAGLAVGMADEARRNPDTKATPTDLVTAADRAAEEAIVKGLLAQRPDDGFEGEEGSSRPGTSGVVWHIDPIDGTTNYVYDLPVFSVSVAAAIDDQVVAGVVYDPTLDRRYRATKGGGATVNGRALQCSTLERIDSALLATGFGSEARRRRHQAEVLVHLLPRVRDIRRLGSAALDLCTVATAQVDAYFERGLNRWDMAAGALIATEAGAQVGNLRGGDGDIDFLLAAPPALFEPLAEILRQAEADSDGEPSPA